MCIYLHCAKNDNQSVRSSAPVVSRCFPGGYNVKLYISRGRLAWWLQAFLHSVLGTDVSYSCQLYINPLFDWALKCFMWSHYLMYNNTTNICIALKYKTSGFNAFRKNSIWSIESILYLANAYFHVKWVYYGNNIIAIAFEVR